jgi:hypothetical protein
MIWFAGDPHGRFEHIIRAVKADPPAAVVLLGDMECSLPLERILSPILDLTEVWFIPGNHDCDEQRYWDNLVNSGLCHRNLHGQVAMIDGLRVAGLGGTFEQAVWLPGYTAGSGHQNYQAMVESFAARNESAEIFDSRCLRYRASIFPDDYFALAMESADILVTHQAPSFHHYGYPEINELAEFMGVQHLFHGHYHEDLRYQASLKESGFDGYSVGFRSIVDLTGRVIYQPK